jgi:hypothetical protein
MFSPALLLGIAEHSPPLQAADMLAYSTYRFELQRRFGEKDGDFPVIPAFTRFITSVAADGGGYDLEALKKLVVMIRENPSGNFWV